jgi:hypothetical protein
LKAPGWNSIEMEEIGGVPFAVSTFRIASVDPSVCDQFGGGNYFARTQGVAKLLEIVRRNWVHRESPLLLPRIDPGEVPVLVDEDSSINSDDCASFSESIPRNHRSGTVALFRSEDLIC